MSNSTSVCPPLPPRRTGAPSIEKEVVHPGAERSPSPTALPLPASPTPGSQAKERNGEKDYSSKPPKLNLLGFEDFLAGAIIVVIFTFLVDSHPGRLSEADLFFVLSMAFIGFAMIKWVRFSKWRVEYDVWHRSLDVSVRAWYREPEKFEGPPTKTKTIHMLMDFRK